MSEELEHKWEDFYNKTKANFIGMVLAKVEISHYWKKEALALFKASVEGQKFEASSDYEHNTIDESEYDYDPNNCKPIDEEDFKIIDVNLNKIKPSKNSKIIKVIDVLDDFMEIDIC